MKKSILTLVLIINCALLLSYGQQTIRYPELKKQIDSLAALDRTASHKTMADTTGKRDSLNKIFKKVAESNTAIIKPIFEKYGFLDHDIVGKQGSDNFWLIVQHATHDVVFQQAVLEKMKVAVLKKKANGGNFAYLVDKVNINLGKLQVYGTQLSYKQDGTPVPKPLIDPANVNKRRRDIGMEPLEDYLKFVFEASSKTQ